MIEVTLRLKDEDSLAFLTRPEGAEVYRFRLVDLGGGVYGLEGLAKRGYAEDTGVGKVVAVDDHEAWIGKRDPNSSWSQARRRTK